MKKILSLILTTIIVISTLTIGVSAVTVVHDFSNTIDNVVYQLKYDTGKESTVASWTPIRINGNVGYCIQKGVDLPATSDMVEVTPDSTDEDFMMFTFYDYYGRYLDVANLDNSTLCEIYVQFMVWERQGHQITGTDLGGRFLVNYIDYDEYLDFKTKVNAEIAKFQTTPSFNGQTIDLEVGESITLTDTFGSFENYSDSPIVNTTGLDIVKDGNTLTLTAKSTSNSTGALVYGYDIAREYTSQGTGFYYEDDVDQNVVTCNFNGDPAFITLAVNVALTGEMKIVKASDDGVVSNMTFNVSGNGVDKDYTTGSDGTVTITDLTAGTYTVTEVNTPDRYETPKAQTVTVTANTTTTVNFTNSLKQGDLKIAKTSDDNIVAGLEFTITGGGENYTKTTDSNGNINISDLNVYDSNNNLITYTITEVNTPTRYEEPQSQTTTLTANSTTTVNFTNSLKTGTIKIVKTSDDGIVGGLEFKISGGGKEYTKTTDSSGVINFTKIPVYDSNNQVITYTITEVDTPNRYEDPQSQTTTLTVNGTTTVNFTNELKKGDLKLVKTSEDGVVEGFEFKITADGQEYTKTTDENGNIDISDLVVYDSNNKLIVYTITEVDTPIRYEEPEKQEITLTANTTTTVSFTNNLKQGDLKLVKISEDNVVEGFTFQITGDGKSYLKTTDENGYIDISDLDVYDINNKIIVYTITEVNTPDRYNSPASQSITITENETKTVTFTNSLKNGNIRLVKTSDDGIVSGLKFQITGGGQEYIVKTDSSGYINIYDLPVYDSNNQVITYTITEIDTPTRYEEPQSQTVILTVNFTKTVTFNNVLKKGSIELTKTSDDGIVEGFEFTLTGNGKEYTGTTDENGNIIFEDLDIYDTGNKVITYTVMENDTPIRYIEPTEQTVSIDTETTTATVAFENILKKGVIELTKTSDDDVLEGFTFTLTGGGKEYAGITDENGYIIFEDLDIYDSNNEVIVYTVKESDTPIRYIEPTEQTVSIDIETATATVAFENIRKKGVIELTKISEDDVVEGIEFTLTGGDKELTGVTDENGNIIFTDLDIYDINNDIIMYTVTENDVAIKYVESTEQTVSINAETGKTIISFDNKLKKGTIELTKTSEDGVLEGFEFTLTGNGKEITGITDENGNIIFENLDIYDSNNEVITYTVMENDTPIRYIEPTEQTVLIDTETGTATLDFENLLKKGTVELTKTSEDDVLEGFEFTLTGNGKEITGTTDENGYIIFENLDIYDSNNEIIVYTVMENDTPDRYVEPTEQTVSIDTETATATVEFYNELVNIPNTGDYASPIGAIILSISSLFIIALILKKKVKN